MREVPRTDHGQDLLRQAEYRPGAKEKVAEENGGIPQEEG